MTLSWSYISWNDMMMWSGPRFFSKIATAALNATAIGVTVPSMAFDAARAAITSLWRSPIYQMISSCFGSISMRFSAKRIGSGFGFEFLISSLNTVVLK